MHNVKIAEKFEEIADLLEIKGENPFRIRAYRNAARVLRGLEREVGDMIAAGADLTELPGVGKDLAGKIRDVVESGDIELLRRLHRQLPARIVELLRLPGLGPKRVKLLHDRLKVRSLDDLRRAVEAGRLRGITGFGPRIQAQLMKAVTAREASGKRFLLPMAEAEARALVTYLRGATGVKQVIVAGSLRRARETVGDLDILMTTTNPAAAMERLVGYESVTQVVARGATKAAVVLGSGLQVDLRVVDESAYGAALVYFTGSKAHNIAIRRRGQERGLKISEYGVFKGERRIAGATEESVYRSVGLPLIFPELREERGEIAAAAAGKLPNLIELRDLRGDLHIHTKASDGQASLEDMAQGARQHGLQYLAITEHSRRLAIAHGLDAKRLGRHMEAIDRLNEKLTGIKLLKGIEVDILEDGTLDLPDRVLAGLDLVVGAIHSQLLLPAVKQTGRILRAMDRPHFSILAHPTGRLLGQREPSSFDFERICRAAFDRGCILELNSQPDRLDLSDTLCQTAKAAGVLIAVSSDAHRVSDLGFLRFGIGQARRGWLEAKDVINTLPLAKLRQVLKRTMR